MNDARQSSLPTICIVADGLSRASETFVRRHLLALNDGRTVGLVRKIGRPVDGHPILHWPRRRFARRRFFRLPLPAAYLDEFCTFRDQNRIGLMLAEFGTVGVDAFEIARASQLPMFCYFRGYDASKRLSSPSYRRRLQAMFASIDGVVAVSAFLVAKLEEAGLRHPNTLVIPSGVDTDLFRPGDKDPNLVLYVGRLVDKKAPLAVVRSFAAATADQPAARLEMIGDGPLARQLRREVDHLGLADRVVLHGERSHAFVQERMAVASIYVQHSVTTGSGETEGAPSSIQEAMAAGMAVVASQHAGIPELVTDNKNGLLRGERDEAGFADALRQLLVDEGLRKRLSAAARQRAVLDFDFRALHSRLEAAFAAVLAFRS